MRKGGLLHEQACNREVGDGARPSLDLNLDGTRMHIHEISCGAAPDNKCVKRSFSHGLQPSIGTKDTPHVYANRKMEQGNSIAGAVDGGGTVRIPGETTELPPSEAGSTWNEGAGRATDDEKHEDPAAVEHRAGDGAIVAPTKRKSHRPSLEAVEVKVDSFYEKGAFKQELQHGELARNNIAPHHSFGMDTARIDNLKYIEPGKVMYAAGNTLVILEVSTMKRRVIFGLDGGGVGCFAVHPTGTFVAVGDKGSWPNIYVYEYPSFKIVKVLRKGTERGYRAMDFTVTGEKLASVGQAPDFMLTVWDWVNEKVILHCKAYGQDVAKVSFSPDDEGRLTTSGTGHIRFWRVASTFTGLKLQGEIGKFGKIEMTDIDCFCHMPDGKVVSGAESGSLLVWEGQFIKCRVVRPDKTGCHDGAVLHVSLDRTDMLVVTAGADGYVRWWSFVSIDTADADDDSALCEVAPLRELLIGDGVKARCVERGGVRGDPSDHLLITDGTGALRKVSLSESMVVAAAGIADTLSPGTTNLATFHAGAITGVDTSFLEKLAATCGVDGTVRIWDFLVKKPLEMARFPRPAQCLQWANDHVDPAGHTVVVGFSDGVVRVLVRDPRGEGARSGGGSNGAGEGNGSLRRAQTLKPHDGGVVALAYSPNGKLLATVGNDRKLFFIKSYLTAEMQDYQPVGFYTLPSTPTSVCWSEDSSSVIVTGIGGEVAQVDLSGGHLDGVDSSQSFEVPSIPVRWYTFKRRPPQSPSGAVDRDLPEEADGEPPPPDNAEAGGDINDGDQEANDDMPEEILPPPPALRAVYAREGGGKFLLAMGGWARGVIFECSWETEYPVRVFPAGYGPASTAAAGAKPPTITTLRYYGTSTVDTSSRRMSRDNPPGEGDGELLLCGCDDGAVTVRPALAAGVYARIQAHDGDASVAAAACSFDGEWIVSGDSDGLLAVHRLRRKPFEVSALELSERMKHVPIPSALSPASSRMASSKKRGQSPVREPPPAPRATEAARPPSFLHEYMDDGQGAVAELDGFEPVRPVSQGFGSEAPLIEKEAPDILDEAAYSIQEDKLKTEDDNRRMAAEAKKEGVRAMIRQMQAEFARFVEENASAPPGERLTEADMLIDPGYEEILKQQGKELCAEVTRELEYSMEESELRLAKLRRRFTDNVEMECITMRALQWDYEVSSFRVEKPSAGLRKLLDAVHKQIRDEERENMAAQAEINTKSKSEAGLTSSGAVGTQGLSSKDDTSAAADGGGGNRAGAKVAGDGEGGTEEKISTFEARKAKRHARQMALAKLLTEKPAEDADDPRDVAAIALANANMGDYKLKSSPDYEVPEEMQLNVSKKQREMVLLEDSMHTIRSRFNTRFLSLRAIKREILGTVLADNRRLKEIAAELGEDGNGKGNLWEPALDPSEWPEMRDYVSPEEVKAYAESCKAAAEAGAAKGSKAAGHTNLPPAPPRVTLTLSDLAAAEETRRVELQQDSAGGDSPSTNVEATTAAGEGSSAHGLSSGSELADSSAGAASVDAVVRMLRDVDGMINRLPAARGLKAPADGELSALEEEERAARDMLLRHEKRTILEAAAENILAFDEAVYDLRRERMLTAAHLKAAELKLLVLRQELELLNQFDAKDRALSAKMEKQQNDKKEVVTAITASKAKLSATQAEAEAGAGLEAQVLAEFVALIPEANQFHEVLNKIFRKKMKRAKKRLSGTDEEGEEESEEEESDEEEDYDFDNDEEEVDDGCPPGCDIGLYEKVLALRERRLDHEETLVEVQKATDEHKRNLDRQTTRQRQIDKDLKQTAMEMKAAQADKQTELNKLDVVVYLKLNQLHCLDNAIEGHAGEGGDDTDKPRRRGSISRPKLVADAGMDTHILFTRAGLDRLKRRISELVQENKEERNNFKELHRDRSRLEKARVVKEAEKEEHQARCNQIQVLKFGKLIDLEMVDKVSSGMSQEEARRRVEAIENKHATELARLEERNRGLRSRLLESTYENTKLLRDVADLSSRQFTLEKELNTSGGSAALGSRRSTLRKEAEERDRLAALVKLQGRELDAIKAEINLLRRKGGHIYAPVPLPPIQQHHEQEFYPAPASDNQMDDARDNHYRKEPNAMLEDSQGDTVQPQVERGEQQQQQQQEYPETDGGEPIAQPGIGTETEY